MGLHFWRPKKSSEPFPGPGAPDPVMGLGMQVAGPSNPFTREAPEVQSRERATSVTTYKEHRQPQQHSSLAAVTRSLPTSQAFIFLDKMGIITTYAPRLSVMTEYHTT